AQVHWDAGDVQRAVIDEIDVRRALHAVHERVELQHRRAASSHAERPYAAGRASYAGRARDADQDVVVVDVHEPRQLVGDAEAGTGDRVPRARRVRANPAVSRAAAGDDDARDRRLPPRGRRDEQEGRNEKDFQQRFHDRPLSRSSPFAVHAGTTFAAGRQDVVVGRSRNATFWGRRIEYTS